jgi:hypothetical protein
VDTLWKGRAACDVEAILAACTRKVKFFSAVDTSQKFSYCRLTRGHTPGQMSLTLVSRARKGCLSYTALLSDVEKA